MRRTWNMGLLLPLGWLVIYGHVQAQIYMCKDEAGRTISSDRTIPECANRALRELDRSGRARREIPPPMTAEDRRQVQLQEEKRKADEASAAEMRRNDRLLRARYRSEADIATARQRELDIVEEHIRRERTLLANLEKQHQKAQAEANALKEKRAPVPTALLQQLDDDVQSMESTKKKIREYEAEAVQTNAKYDATLDRYRGLTATQASK